MFQFPSNGKAHGKETFESFSNGRTFSFNSLQTGKHMESETVDRAVTSVGKSFNSLQTGKHMEREQNPDITTNGDSFNSLQTGKHMEREDPEVADFWMTKYVSIPFKRESTWKGCNNWRTWEHTGFRFNSLQTGKHMERRKTAVLM